MNSSSPEVLTDIAGSRVVVQYSQWEYIDARVDARKPGWSTVEYVSGGHVCNTVEVRDTHAPEYIVSLMRGLRPC